MMSRQTLLFLVGMLILLLLAGCNLPGNQGGITEGVPPDAVFTVAAETLAARLTQTLPPTQPAEPPTATPEPPAVLPPSATPQPSPSSTPTASPSPTEAAPPTQIPQLIFFDDFSDTNRWYDNQESDRYGFKYTAQGYHIYNSIALGLIWSIREQTYSSVALEVDGTRLDGPAESYFGVVCNFSDDGDNYYALAIGDDGFYGLGLMEDGEFRFLASGVDDSGAIERGHGKTNRIRGVCNGNHFLLYANGELLLDAWDNTLTEGIVGLVVGNKRTEGRAEFRFNDFAITYP